MITISTGDYTTISIHALRVEGDIDVPAISVSILEDKSIQNVHRKLGIQAFKPLKSKVQVIREFG